MMNADPKWPSLPSKQKWKKSPSSRCKTKVRELLFRFIYSLHTVDVNIGFKDKMRQKFNLL